MPSFRTFFLSLTGVASLLMAGCTSSSSVPAAKPGDAQAVTVFGDEISFTGYGIMYRDGHTELELRWSDLRMPAAPYYVFVHALDSSGAIAFQGDHQLKDAAGQPTTSWTAGEAVSDRFLMTPPPGHPNGAYTLRIGLYTLTPNTPNPIKLLQITRASVPMPTDGWKDRAILLTDVECK
jgi:hypothetical protein